MELGIQGDGLAIGSALHDARLRVADKQHRSLCALSARAFSVLTRVAVLIQQADLSAGRNVQPGFYGAPITQGRCRSRHWR